MPLFRDGNPRAVASKRRERSSEAATHQRILLSPFPSTLVHEMVSGKVADHRRNTVKNGLCGELLSVASAELAATYAALALADASHEITSEKIIALTSAAGIELEPIWATLLAKALEGKNVKDLLSNVGGGGAPAAGAAAPAAAAAGGAAPAEAAKEEKKEEEKEESDDDMANYSARPSSTPQLETRLKYRLDQPWIPIRAFARTEFFVHYPNSELISPSSISEFVIGIPRAWSFWKRVLPDNQSNFGIGTKLMETDCPVKTGIQICPLKGSNRSTISHFILYPLAGADPDCVQPCGTGPLGETPPRLYSYTPTQKCVDLLCHMLAL
ncbi:60s acidic ribosomal domain-containing protein [Rhizoctonia solani AG-1 IA]|uniref:60s acidic ribosomal domain-containing protein n=1 Tax=Thanatephorus cucumeris (strain AG1-IA) TaxID=983506 RepID=L8WWA9_THACA|nr:60s acidic ribosomal domain-containing protein [Rhizoctonia solani AG-1 IA]